MPEHFVYFVQDSRSGFVKIGTAINVPARVRQLQTGNRAPLRLLGYIHGDLKREKGIHHQLRAHRLRGEWFERDAVFAFLQTIPPEQWVYLNAPSRDTKAQERAAGAGCAPTAKPRVNKRRWTADERRRKAA